MVELVAWATLRPRWLATTLPTHVPKLLLALSQLPRRLLSATHEFRIPNLADPIVVMHPLQRSLGLGKSRTALALLPFVYPNPNP